MGRLILRAIVWVGAFLWWAYLKKPAGASFADIQTGPARLIGLGLVAAGGGLWLWSMLSLDLSPPTTIVTRGPYRHVRNPLYLAAGVLGAGIATIYAPWSVAAAVRAAIVAVMVHVAVVRLEELRTLARFGPAYEAYCRTVPRWVPGLTPSRPGSW